MKFKFKKQDYQTRAVESVVDCFKGQPNTAGIGYRIDPGHPETDQIDLFDSSIGFKNGNNISRSASVISF